MLKGSVHMGKAFLTLLLITGSCISAGAATGTCTATARCAVSEASCTAGTGEGIYTWGSISATCSENAGKYLSCAERRIDNGGKVTSVVAKYICCDTSGSSFSTNLEAEAKAVCVGH